MLKKEVARGARGHVLIMDSITKVTPEDQGAVVVSASHGGASSGEFALEVPLKLAFFNDAGVGKDDAGIFSLALLQSRGVACGTVSHGVRRHPRSGCDSGYRRSVSVAPCLELLRSQQR